MKGPEIEGKLWFEVQYSKEYKKLKMKWIETSKCNYQDYEGGVDPIHNPDSLFQDIFEGGTGEWRDIFEYLQMPIDYKSEIYEPVEKEIRKTESWIFEKGK